MSVFADECDWLTYVNTRYIFCDDDQKVVYGDGDNNADDDDTGIYGQGSHPSVISYDEYKKAIDAARGKSTEEYSVAKIKKATVGADQKPTVAINLV